MAIKIEKRGNKFIAKITPPHGSAIPWQSSTPLELDSLIEELRNRGCHQTDIADALYELDPKLIGMK